MGIRDKLSRVGLIADKAKCAFEDGHYADARQCVGELELEARIGGFSSRDVARLAGNVAVLDLVDARREVRLDAPGFRDTLHRAESRFRAAGASDAEPADLEADARESRILRANIAWATMRCGGDGDADAIPNLQRVFDETVATDDGSSWEDTLHETMHVTSMLLRALAASGSRGDAQKALAILSVAEAMTTPDGENADEKADARRWILRQRARFSMTLGDLVTAREILREMRSKRTDHPSSTALDEIQSLRARLAYLEGNGPAAIRALGERKMTKPHDNARTVNLASVLERSGASATASFLLDVVCSRRGDGDARDDARAFAKTRTDVSLDDGVKSAAAYRAGVLLLRAKKPAAAALRILAAENAKVGVPEKCVRLAECACCHAARGDEADEDEREAAAAFVAVSDGVPLTFSGAQTYLDSALVGLYADDDDKDEASTRSFFRQPRLRAHAHAQRAYVCLALGKRLDALSSAGEVLTIVAAARKNGKRPLGDAKGSAVEKDGFEGDELEAYERLAKEYAAEASRALGRHEEAANGLKASNAKQR